MSSEARPVSPAVEAFRALHESSCFVMPNPWDVGTALYLERLGFKAIATTSSGFAFSRGLPDSTAAVPLEAMLGHIGDIVRAASVPVNADFLSGYADEPEGVAANVTLCVATGAAGLSIEDSTGDDATPLYERTLAIERVRAARSAIETTGSQVVLTARCEAWLVGDPDPARTALDRLVAFADAGADCLYAPGVTDPGQIATIVKAVAPKPVNVLVSSPVLGLSVAVLADLGVRRISVGSGLARVAWGAFVRAATGLVENGTFDGFAGSMSHAELDAFFRERLG
ncbi:MAG: isocitrate lyase/phosphoenolpyruvate mutase family protein [Chloroflexota bacterium]